MQTPTTAGTCCGGGGGGGGIIVDNNGQQIVDPATTLDFDSSFVVTDEGGGVAGIALAGGPVARAFQYIATGGENLNGFQIPFTPLGSTNYAFSISIVLENSDPNDMYGWIALSKATDHITIATSQTPNSGDSFEVMITLYTP